MLALVPPYPVFDGYALLPDHADKALWHVLPSAPRLAVVGGRPEFVLTQYLGGGAGAAKISGGILQLTTQLTVPDDVLAALPEKLAAFLGPGTAAPRVVPVLFDSGSVELTILGRTSTPPAAGSASPGGVFEVTFSAGGKPSMSGTNDCTFQLMLNENAAQAIAGCIDQPELPVVVVYAMTFAALRPSFTIDIHADWHRVYSTLQNKLTANAWVAATDVDVSISSALEESGVHVDTVIEGGESSAAAAAKTREKLIDWVLERLFVPMIPPQSVGSTVGQIVGDTVWSLQRAILPGVSYKLKQQDEKQLRLMDIRATERVAEARELRPQGMLGELLRGLRVDKFGAPSPAWPAIRAGMLQQVELDAFPRLEVSVGVEDRFVSDGLRSCRVQLARRLPDGTHADQAELIFTSAAARKDWVVNLIDEAARERVWDVPYEYRVLAEFDLASPLRPPTDAVSPWVSKHANELIVDPREAYSVTDVTVTVAPLFSFALFPAVSVELRPGGSGPGGVPLPEGDAARTAHLSLAADSSVRHWQYAALGTDRTPYHWRAIYHRPLEAGGDTATEWHEALDPWLSLPDPMPEKLQASFFVDLPWQEIVLALLQIRYEDEPHDVHYEVETVTLSAATPVLSRTYSIASGGSRSVSYRLTIKLATGGLMEGSWREATDDRIVVDRRLVDERQVTVRAVGALADRHLVDAHVALEVRDPATQQVRAAKTVTVPAGAEPGFTAAFSYLRGDPPLLQVSYQLTVVDSNGFVRTQPWASSVSDLLVIDLRNETVKA